MKVRVMLWSLKRSLSLRLGNIESRRSFCPSCWEVEPSIPRLGLTRKMGTLDFGKCGGICSSTNGSDCELVEEWNSKFGMIGEEQEAAACEEGIGGGCGPIEVGVVSRGFVFVVEPVASDEGGGELS